jgi:ketosteroid isomerase-like protein
MEFVSGGKEEGMQRRQKGWALRILAVAGSIAMTIVTARAGGSRADDEKTVTELDRQFQEAVKNNDVATMDRLLADDFVLVSGRGRTQSKADLLKESSRGAYVYEHQEDTNQTVHVWGDTAVITALLWVKGTVSGKPFDYTMWFSDVYVRNANGWKYVFGQVGSHVEDTH